MQFKYIQRLSLAPNDLTLLGQEESCSDLCKINISSCHEARPCVPDCNPYMWYLGC